MNCFNPLTLKPLQADLTKQKSLLYHTVFLAILHLNVASRPTHLHAASPTFH